MMDITAAESSRAPSTQLNPPHSYFSKAMRVQVIRSERGNLHTSLSEQDHRTAYTRPFASVVPCYQHVSTSCRSRFQKPGQLSSVPVPVWRRRRSPGVALAAVFFCQLVHCPTRLVLHGTCLWYSSTVSPLTQGRKNEMPSSIAAP